MSRSSRSSVSHQADNEAEGEEGEDRFPLQTSSTSPPTPPPLSDSTYRSASPARYPTMSHSPSLASSRRSSVRDDSDGAADNPNIFMVSTTEHSSVAAKSEPVRRESYSRSTASSSMTSSGVAVPSPPPPETERLYHAPAATSTNTPAKPKQQQQQQSHNHHHHYHHHHGTSDWREKEKQQTWLAGELNFFFSALSTGNSEHAVENGRRWYAVQAFRSHRHSGLAVCQETTSVG